MEKFLLDWAFIIIKKVRKAIALDWREKGIELCSCIIPEYSQIQNKTETEKRCVQLGSNLENYLFFPNDFHGEEELFKIIGTYGLDDHLINQDYENRKKFKINQYNKLKQFMNLLNDEEINSNMYLKAVKQFMEISEIDCLNII